MVGNSSSGLSEAASFLLPVVNIGERQKGRQSSSNVIFCPCATNKIIPAWRKALSNEFRKTLAGGINPYSKKNAVSCIVDTLASTQLNRKMQVKHFVDLTASLGQNIV